MDWYVKTPQIWLKMAEICENLYICSFRANVVGYPIILQPRDHHHWLQHEKRVQKRLFHHLISQNGTFLDHTNYFRPSCPLVPSPIQDAVSGSNSRLNLSWTTNSVVWREQLQDHLIPTCLLWANARPAYAILMICRLLSAALVVRHGRIVELKGWHVIDCVGCVGLQRQ